ncbi:cell division protein FtsZ [Brachyspira aalborgi]|jgi:cell division protein FtsZ|uniref:Cell division protein FtsZ n=1 Tax=Brachyspira aalborgi TaxID=29522 RepID=A0AB38PUX5_9SPIR|nr:cell division protein FtsZ [Brachyspira aalborgi]MBS4763709.1 cell division protein FtsZ [Brachyspira sp.]CCY77608.1 cell division protein FtsZ [Brachyspira sp. CAG:700]TXJ15524.1 cell division protein FtsZ [Brachyspira aalborgi]TXJ17839.1 cell division protein FtsZ [Brachyspira aalborgi]TXJ23790.1 cell division protein FtsZ [Brachyspira aalborgi]
MDSKYRIELADNSKMNSNINSFNVSLGTVIKVIGVGNGGCNAVNRMIEEKLNGVDFVAMNTDKQALSRSNAETKIVLGERVTQGLGAGTDPEKGAEAAKEDVAKIEEIINGANLVFIASSFGGGTGTGASPVVAEIAKKCGALTIGVVTKPFKYEGKLKMNRAEAGIEKMFSVVDSLIIIPNENLYDMVDAENYGYTEAFSIIDDILRQGVQGISDIITQTGFGVNVDFADVRTMIALSNGRAHLGIGIGKGENRIEKAISNAFENPLLDVSSIKNSRGVLANIVAPKDFGLKEYGEAAEKINSYAHEEANIKIGTCIDESLNDEIRVTIVATGFDDNCNKNNEAENKDFESDKNDIKDNNIKNDLNINNIIENNENNNSNETIIDNSKEIDLKDEENINKVSFESVNFANKFKNQSLNNYNINNAENNEEEDFDKKEESIEKSEYAPFNKNIVNNQISKSANSIIDRNEEFYSRTIATEVAEADIDIKENEVKKEKPIFDIMSDEGMKIHNDLGAKSYIFGADTNSSADYDEDTPAYLRRQIIARNIRK